MFMQCRSIHPSIDRSIVHTTQDRVAVDSSIVCVLRAGALQDDDDDDDDDQRVCVCLPAYPIQACLFCSPSFDSDLI